MKKYSLFLLVLVAVLSFCGCKATENTNSSVDPVSIEGLIVTENGVTYLRDPEKTLEITCGYFDDDDDKHIEFEIKDPAFYDKLKEIIDGKEACDYSCKCAGDYQVSIADNYWLYLHPDRITVNFKLNGYQAFTVECSQEEMQELYDIIESEK